MSQSLLPPTSISGIVGTGGSLAAGTYYYGVTALTPAGETKLSPVHGYTAGAGGQVTLTWPGPVDAMGYKIYRGTDSAHLQLLATVAHQTTQPNDPGCTWTDRREPARRPRYPRPPRTRRRRRANGTPSGAGGSFTCPPIPVTTATSPMDEPADPRRASPAGPATASGLPVVGGMITLGDLGDGSHRPRDRDHGATRW